jgi:hypothetical protein
MQNLWPCLQVLLEPNWPEKWPFRPELFARYDEAPDTQFYSQPRFVTHIDDPAIEALTKCVLGWLGSLQSVCVLSLSWYHS